MDHRPSDSFIAQVLRQPIEIHRMPAVVDPRYEVKFTAEQTRLAALTSWIRTHRAGWQSAFPDRVVTNVYFDTPALDAYEDNQAGISERRKLRYRWYGDTWQPVAGTMEIKCRSGGAGWKWSAPVEHPLDLTRITWQQFRDRLRANLPPVQRFMLDEQPIVALINRYHRTYFASRDGRLRLTIDEGIAFYPQLGRGRPQVRHAAHRANAIVVEVKCAVTDRALAADALGDIPLRVSRHSKYAIGVESLDNL